MAKQPEDPDTAEGGDQTDVERGPAPGGEPGVSAAAAEPTAAQIGREAEPQGAAPSRAPRETSAARRARPDPATALGQATLVMMASPVHKHLFLTDLEWLLVPAIAANQYRIFRSQNRPVGLATWALLTEEAEARLKAGHRRLRPADWTAGDRLWLIDLVAPLGGADRMAAELRDGPFKGRQVKTLQPAPDGKGVAVVEW